MGKINDAQLRQYLISELERFHQQPQKSEKKAALNIGRQPEGNAYVFNQTAQVWQSKNHYFLCTKAISKCQ